MHHMGCGELVHARWKSRRLLAVVSLSFGVGETNCLQGKAKLEEGIIRLKELCNHIGIIVGKLGAAVLRKISEPPLICTLTAW